MSFEPKLAEGIIRERILAQWFRSYGWAIFPVYPTVEAFKGPTVFSPGRETLIATDMLIFKPGGEVRWVAHSYVTKGTP